jgi:hypothetical protein
VNPRSDHVRRSWRRTVWFLRLFPFWIALIVGLNIWDAHAKGRPFNWTNIWYGIEFLVFTTFLGLWMWLIYKFVLRYANHRDGKS